MSSKKNAAPAKTGATATTPASKKAAAPKPAKSAVSSGLMESISGLGAGVEALFSAPDILEFDVDLDLVEVVEQVRTVFDSDDQTLEDLGESLLKFQIAPILLRVMPEGHPFRYRLVAGERRYRAARLKGMAKLRAKAKTMTDEEADELQFVENTHRLNLSQIEEAKRVQRDLNTLGSVEKVLQKYKKSNAWLSKLLGLLTLPEQTRRLISEGISADIETISNVRQVEKVDPAAAAEVVKELAEGRGKVNARQVSQEAKEKAKAKAGKPAKQKTDKKTAKEQEQGNINFAPAKNDAAGEGEGSDTQAAHDLPPVRPLLSAAYQAIYEKGTQPARVLEGWTEAEADAVASHLSTYYEAGKQSKDSGRAVIEGFRNGQFSCDGDSAFHLVAFLHGADSGGSFVVLNILGSVKERARRGGFYPPAFFRYAELRRWRICLALCNSSRSQEKHK